MKKRGLILLSIVSCLFYLVKGQHTALTQKQRVQWFEEARLGAMIHWSLSTPAAGRFYGEPVRNSGYSEWLMAHNKIRNAEWINMAKRMSITEEAIDHWVRTIKDGGFKYLTFVAKHHDGVAFWNSAVDDNTFGKLSGTNFDVLECVKEKCEKYNIVLCVYYSQWLDWIDEHGTFNDWNYEQENMSTDDLVKAGRGSLNYPLRTLPTREEYDIYWRKKAMPQVEELITKYGVKLIWFDCWRSDPVGTTLMTQQQLDDMLALIRRLDPTVLVNTRLGIHEVSDEGVDYQTMGDNEFPAKPLGHTWETAATVNHTWGYGRDDLNWRSTTFFVQEFVKAIAKGGNLLLNIGPRADGSIPREIETRMSEIGETIRQNKVGFYETFPSPFDEKSQDWGVITQELPKHGKTKLFLHVLEWPTDGIIRVNGLKNKVLSVHIPSLGNDLEFTQYDLLLHVKGPRKEPVNFDTVIEVEIEGETEVEQGLSGEINFGGIQLAVSQAKLKGDITIRKDNSASAHGVAPAPLVDWEKGPATASWRVYVPRPGKRKLLISYACGDNSIGAAYKVNVSDFPEISATTLTGPKDLLRGHDEYYSRLLAVLNFQKAGVYTISFENESLKDFKLNWLFLTEDEE